MEEDTVICLIWHVPFWTYYLLPMKGIHEIKVKVSGYNVIYSLQGRLRGRRHTSTESQSQSPTSSLVWSSLASQRGKINSNWSSSTRRWAVTRDTWWCHVLTRVCEQGHVTMVQESQQNKRCSAADLYVVPYGRYNLMESMPLSMMKHLEDDVPPVFMILDTFDKDIKVRIN